MALEKINRQNISDIVFEQLKDHILSEKWRSGEKIPSEASLVSQLGVSRITIRNALQRLTSLGLIESKQGEGTFVRDRSGADTLASLMPILSYVKPDVKYFLEFRMAIEPDMASLASLRASDIQIKKMEENVLNFEKVAKYDLQQALKYDLAFHSIIAEATGNPIIIKTYEVFKDIYKGSLKEIIEQLGTECGTQYHRKILNAIRERNPELARKNMRLHLASTIEMFQGVTNTKKELKDNCEN